MQLLLDFARGCSLDADARWLPLLQWTASVTAATPSIFFKLLPPWWQTPNKMTITLARPGAGSKHQSHHISLETRPPVLLQTSPHTAKRGTETIHEQIQPTSSSLTGGSIHEAKDWIFSKEPVMVKMFRQCEVDKEARLSFDTFLQVGWLMLDWIGCPLTLFGKSGDWCWIDRHMKMISFYYHSHTCIKYRSTNLLQTHTTEGSYIPNMAVHIWYNFVWYRQWIEQVCLVWNIAWHNKTMPWQANSGMTIHFVVCGVHVLLHKSIMPQCKQLTKRQRHVVCLLVNCHFK